jgi:cell division protein FtsX
VKRSVGFAAVFVAALLVLPFLPVCTTMVRLQISDRAGDVVDMGWKLSSLWNFWSDYDYFRPEQNRAFWLGVNVVLWIVYAVLLALGVTALWVRWRRRKD